MNRKTTLSRSTTWVCPAGVTAIYIDISNSTSLTGAGRSVMIPLTVVPNTSYTVTINNASVVLNNANTFGSIFTWTGSGFIRITWVE